MTESEWLECRDPNSLRSFPLQRRCVNERKDRLFACACCRRMWALLPDHRSRAAVEVAERYADGRMSAPELEAAWAAAKDVPGEPVLTFRSLGGKLFHVTPASVASRVGQTCGSRYTSQHTSRNAALLIAEYVAAGGDWSAVHEEHGLQANLLRDIFGNPFRPVAFAAGWRTPDVLGIAEGVYEDGAYERLPILADALEDADCDDANILSHCRGPGPHVRGCWVIDLILGKA